MERWPRASENFIKASEFMIILHCLHSKSVKFSAVWSSQGSRKKSLMLKTRAEHCLGSAYLQTQHGAEWEKWLHPKEQHTVIFRCQRGEFSVKNTHTPLPVTPVICLLERWGGVLAITSVTTRQLMWRIGYVARAGSWEICTNACIGKTVCNTWGRAVLHWLWDSLTWSFQVLSLHETHWDYLRLVSKWPWDTMTAWTPQYGFHKTTQSVQMELWPGLNNMGVTVSYLQTFSWV